MAHGGVRNDFGVKSVGDEYKHGVENKFHSRVVSGRFQMGWKDFKRPGVTDLMKFLATGSRASLPSSQELNAHLPVKTWKQSDWPAPPNKGVRVTWLGHACVLLQMDGVNILTDPIFSDRCGPIQFGFSPKRYRPSPCQVNDLPTIHAVVISHNHYDHLDRTTVDLLNQRFGDSLVWFVPLRMGSWMSSMGCRSVVELDWWQEAFLKSPTSGSDLTFVHTPAQHWSKRGVGDDNQVLWGSWCILGKYKFFFAGDTGYDESLFNAIGNKFGPFDLAAIPIGAYEPRWFMQCQHIDPDEAILIHHKIRAKRSIGIHWATFNLSSESCMAPRDKIRELQKGHNETFFTVNPGIDTLLFTADDDITTTSQSDRTLQSTDPAPVHKI